MNFILPFLLALSPAPGATPEQIQETEVYLDRAIEPKEETPLEDIIGNFQTNCNSFYGCGVTYPGIKW